MIFPCFDRKHRKFHRVHESMLVPNLLIYKEKTADGGYLNRYVLDLCCTLPVAGHLDHKPISCASNNWSRKASLGPGLPSWDFFVDTLKVSFAN
jgi:hypothetical protein